MKIKPGKYQHYKGKFYEVLGVARDSETLTELVLYRALYKSEKFGKNALWVRPKKWQTPPPLPVYPKKKTLTPMNQGCVFQIQPGMKRTARIAAP